MSIKKEEEVGQDSKLTDKSKSLDLGAGSPKLQRELSVATILSKDTQSTFAGSVIAPPFKFGCQKIYTPLEGLEPKKFQKFSSKSGATILFASKSGDLPD
jgi:hypothetical protein